MNTKFESSIQNVIKIIDKRIQITLILFFAMVLLTIIFIFLDKVNILYYFFSGSLLILSLLFYNQKRKLSSLLIVYQKNIKDVIDYLAIIIRHYELSQRNFILRTHYKSIIVYYKEAYLALKEE